jgi:hypothetical protein
VKRFGRLNWQGYGKNKREQIQKAVFAQLDLILVATDPVGVLIPEHLANGCCRRQPGGTDLTVEGCRLAGFNRAQFKDRLLVDNTQTREKMKSIQVPKKSRL